MDRHQWWGDLTFYTRELVHPIESSLGSGARWAPDLFFYQYEFRNECYDLQAIKEGLKRSQRLLAR